MDRGIIVERILNSRRHLVTSGNRAERSPAAAEGGCGVLGLACNVPVAGRHVVEAAAQMHNRGNGKGGGIAMAGLDPAQMGVSPDVLRDAYLIQIAYLDPQARQEVERDGLGSFDLLEGYRVPTLDDWREVPEPALSAALRCGAEGPALSADLRSVVEGLELRPPDVWRYFARVKPDALDRFAGTHGLQALSPRAVEDEFVYQNSFRLNQAYYAGSLGSARDGLGGQRAFVLCHGRDLLVLKIVGYAEQVVQYYRLEDLTARVWIAHQRYPTKGRVWHPGGAHPFIGLNEALVHNGDFANYHAVSEYLQQRNIAPLFLTDTEVSVLLFDLLDRVYGYPLEATLEALAPTTERDFAVLPPEKQALYRAVQATHVHASPDGPWFFIVARSRPDAGNANCWASPTRACSVRRFSPSRRMATCSSGWWPRSGRQSTPRCARSRPRTHASCRWPTGTGLPAAAATPMGGRSSLPCTTLPPHLPPSQEGIEGGDTSLVLTSLLPLLPPSRGGIEGGDA